MRLLTTLFFCAPLTALAGEPATYTLITVNRSAQVFHSDGYASLDLCEEARQVALTGETKAQASERRQKEHEDQARRERLRHMRAEMGGGEFPETYLAGEGVVNWQHYPPVVCPAQGCSFGANVPILTTNVSSSNATPVWVTGGTADGVAHAECVIVPRSSEP